MMDNSTVWCSPALQGWLECRSVRKRIGSSDREVEPVPDAHIVVDGPVIRPPQNRNVLLITFDFPPRRTSGVYRPTAFCKYLPQTGWNPTVLTIRGVGGQPEDGSLLRRLPRSVEIVRTRTIDFMAAEAAALRWGRSLGVLQASKPAGGRSVVSSPSQAENDSVDPQGGGMMDRLLRKGAVLLRSLAYFPDHTAGWIPFAMMKALELMRTHRFDVVYTTHPPRAAHVVGLCLKTTRGLPWVAEFRDPWVVPDGAVPISANQVPAPRRIRWLHRSILRSADAVLAVTPGHAQELVEVFRAPAEKVHVVRNGFDEADFVRPPDGACTLFEPGCVNLAHFGMVYSNFSGSFFPAVAELVEREPNVAALLRMHIIGYPDSVAREYAKGRLKGVLRLHGVVPHPEALCAMYASDALLLFYGHGYISRVSVPGKLYEYLRVGRPVIAIAEAGGVQELIESANCGWVIRPDDREGMQRVVRQLATGGRRHQDQSSAVCIFDGFRYDRLAKELSEVFDKVANADSSKR